MLGNLGAALIVLAVTHVVTVACLAWRPYAGPAFAVLAVVCGAGGGCAVDAWLVPVCRSNTRLGGSPALLPT
jgi:hypothetical protein